MTRSRGSPWVKTIFVSIVVFLLVYECRPGFFSHRQPEVFSVDNRTENPLCRTLSNLSSRLNVTGALTTAVNPNSSISLFVAPDSSFETSLYVVEDCSPVIVRPIIGKHNFSFNDLPTGDYVGMVPMDSFFARIQGFPMVREYNRSNFSVKFNFYGGTQEYSVVSFSIDFQEDQKPKNSYS